MSWVASFLRKAAPFANVEERVLLSLAHAAKLVSLRPGETLFDIQPGRDDIYVIRKGLIGLWFEPREGLRLPHEVLGPTSVVGVEGLLEELARGMAAEALTHGTLLRIPMQAVRDQPPEAFDLIDEGFSIIALQRLKRAWAMEVDPSIIYTNQVPCPFDAPAQLTAVHSALTGQIVGHCAFMGECEMGNEHGCPIGSLPGQTLPMLWLSSERRA